MWTEWSYNRYLPDIYLVYNLYFMFIIYATLKVLFHRISCSASCHTRLRPLGLWQPLPGPHRRSLDYAEMDLDIRDQQSLSYSEMKLYKHAITYKWTVDELISTIKLIRSTDFKVGDVNIDLHKRVAAATLVIVFLYFFHINVVS